LLYFHASINMPVMATMPPRQCEHITL